MFGLKFGRLFEMVVGERCAIVKVCGKEYVIFDSVVAKKVKELGREGRYEEIIALLE